MALTTTTLLPLGLYPAKTHNLGPVALPVGVSAATLAVDRSTWNDPALQVTASLEFSPDGGATWFPWGSFGTVGGVLTNPKTGLPAVVSRQSSSFIHRIAGDGYGLMNEYTSGLPYAQAPGTIEPGFEPTNPNRMVRGTVTITAAVTTAVLMTLDDAAVPLTLPPVAPHQSVSIADITFNKTSAAAVITLTTPAFTVTSNANRAGLLALGLSQDTVTTITGNIGGVSGVAIANTDPGSSQPGVRTVMFSVINPPAGSQTAKMDWVNGADAALGAMTTSGVDQTTPFNNGTFAFGAAGTASLAITSTNGDLTTDIVSDGDSTAPTSPTQTSLWALGLPQDAGQSYGPGTGTTTHQWTTSSVWTQSGVNWRQAAAVDVKPTVSRQGQGPKFRRAMPQKYADTPAPVVELTARPTAPFRPGRGPGKGPIYLRRRLTWPSATSVTPPSVFSASADSTATFVGQSAAASVFSAAPDSTATFVGASLAAAVFSAAGDSTATFVGKALVAGVFSAAGDSTATFIGKALAASVFVAAADSTATFIGQSTAAAVLSAAADSSASFIGKSFAASVFSASGDSTAAFVAAGAGSTFAAVGSSDAIFVGTAIGQAVLLAQGDSTASWIGIAAGQPVTFDPGARKPRRGRKPEPPYKLHPEEILRQQKMTQDYLDELDRKAATQVTSARQAGIPSGSGAGPARVAPRPRLTAAMAHAATMEQLRAIVAAKLAAERDRARAKQEQQRRRRAIAVAVMLMTY